jgi:hypothetical protein
MIEKKVLSKNKNILKLIAINVKILIVKAYNK